MTIEWRDDQPIYRQLREQVVARIIDGSFPEQEAVPSVRQVAADYRINHLTVAKAYQELVEVGLLEKRRGLGMFVSAGARSALTKDEQTLFFTQEVPAFVARIEQLGLSVDDVLAQLASQGDNKS